MLSSSFSQPSLPPRLALARLRHSLSRRWRSGFERFLMPWDGPAESEWLDIAEFGSNPGRLAMRVFRPTTAMLPGAPLVMLLHGCGQGAGEFATSGGWIEAAIRHGWVLVLPEQAISNNHARCFSWYNHGDTHRGRGEVLSLRQMIQTALRRFRCDRTQVFVAGLSAGGAMAAALLAAYPETFAAGAVVAGLPVGCASNAGEAFLRMHDAGPTKMTPAAWANLIAAQSGHKGRWPRLSIWHGEADRVVDPGNGENLVRQWTALHGLDAVDAAVKQVSPGVTRRIWGHAAAPNVEAWSIAGLDHGFPVGADAARRRPASQWVLGAEIDATEAIVRFWH
ncbi:extracellular catalytic domain type 1 short-chain-length polyhydroxyalkanoate depolymerase [Acidibrevibacterium fodinaquatile]|uniref:extracellular catalytic domain type 1 short-chain-length polyhydroxyalkanoate depolymerase n=1 Tax=Acidibrevibacterium fodinaquatile TaxID=1969806 RepID=UPI0013B40908|nr:PHB depolymerase family esterase [Acidibrevibacterium fodinaquatile]